ncbi:uncharacterized protein M6B38_202955 [Iris pallida]|uniref:Uncharacterized protein n=1 Tax=Iris pallida TaxID=29817 RepID=A0AAX6E8C5_IRIPA|nr:uncharacterized protein M6B38_202955 [Iris pallida]
MLIMSSLSNSLNSTMSFAPDFGEQQNMDLLCDWSQRSATWQKYPIRDIPQGSYKESLHTAEEERKLTCAGVVELSRTYTDPSKDMAASSTPKLDGYVYKRRKLRSNIVVLSEENAEETSKDGAACPAGTNSVVCPMTVQKDELNGVSQHTVDCMHSLDSGNQSTSGQLDLQKPVIPDSENTYVRRRLPKPYQNLRNKLCVVIALPAEVSSGVYSGCSSSKSYTGHGSAVMKTEVNSAKCSPSGAIGAETLEDCTSARELCVPFLKSQELLLGLDTTDCAASIKVLGAITNLTQLCKSCGLLENTLEMLICDLCEEAFHVSCCIPKHKKLPLSIWYCQPCIKKKRKALLQNISSEDRGQNLCGKLGPILLMLRDKQPYKSGARIGKDFQAEVPEWAGPTITNGYDYFDKPSEIDPANYVSLPDWNANKSSEASFISNWIQCRDVIDDNQKDEDTVCGKWRRAPLFVVQTDDWDCSCSLLWDPIHADCAVPQELETEVVLEHLKYIEMLRPKLANKQRHQSSKDKLS